MSFFAPYHGSVSAFVRGMARAAGIPESDLAAAAREYVREQIALIGSVMPEVKGPMESDLAELDHTWPGGPNAAGG